MATSILAWRIPWTEEPDRLQVHGVKRFRQNLAAKPPPPSPNGPNLNIGNAV